MLKLYIATLYSCIPLIGMDVEKKYTKDYIKDNLNSIVEKNMSEMKWGLNFIWGGGDCARNIIKDKGKKRGATELELASLEQFTVINYWYAQSDYETYVEQLTDDAVDKVLKEIDTLNTTDPDAVVKFQNAKYKIENKEIAFTRLIQSAHFNKTINRQL